jgi:hypothetical protein
MSFFGDKFKAELKNLVLEILEELDLYFPPKTTVDTGPGTTVVSGSGLATKTGDTTASNSPTNAKHPK